MYVKGSEETVMVNKGRGTLRAHPKTHHARPKICPTKTQLPKSHSFLQNELRKSLAYNFPPLTKSPTFSFAKKVSLLLKFRYRVGRKLGKYP